MASRATDTVIKTVVIVFKVLAWVTTISVTWIVFDARGAIEALVALIVGGFVFNLVARIVAMFVVVPLAAIAEVLSRRSDRQ